MSPKHKRQDLLFLLLLILILLGLPFALKAYEERQGQEIVRQGTKVFTLTGHAQKGWLTGDVHALDVIALWKHRRGAVAEPVIRVSKGDRVVFKLKSSDVIHGFSLKDFGIFIDKGIEPGKVTLVSFTADRVGVFPFSCNAICGENHESMKGSLVVLA